MGNELRIRDARIARMMMVCVIALAMLLPSAIVLPSRESSLSLAKVQATEDYDGWLYTPYDGTTTETITPQNTGQATLICPTDWGKVKLLGTTSHYMFQPYFGNAQVLYGLFYNTYLGYTYFNGTAKEGRPFHGLFSKVWVSQNTSDYAVYELYAEAPHFWSGSTPEWNVTVRFCIDKHDPYVKIDYWLRNVNASSVIKSVYCGAVAAIGGSSGYTKYTDRCPNVGIVVADDLTWAYGTLGGYVRSASDCDVRYCFSNYTYWRIREDLDESLHGTALMVFGTTKADIEAKVAKISWRAWNHCEERIHKNLVVLKTETGQVDAWDYVSSAYSVIPEHTSMTITVDSVDSALTFGPSPVLNYDRGWVTLSLDMGQYHAGPSYPLLHWWFFNETREYEFRWTACLLPNMTLVGGGDPWEPYELRMVANQTAYFDGTQYEIGDHGWNHTSLFEFPTATYAYDTFMLSVDQWADYSSDPLYAYAFPGNAWGYESWEGLEVGGVRSARLGTYSTETTLSRDFGDLWLIDWQSMTGHFDPSTIATKTQNAVDRGYYLIQSHIDDYGNEFAGTDDWVQQFMSSVQNSSEIISVTFSQLNDLVHGRLQYYEAAEEYYLQTVDCLDEHALILDASSGVRPIWIDESSGSLSSVSSISDSVASGLYLQRETTYRAAPFVVDVASGTYDFELIEWGANKKWTMDGAETSVTYNLTGLDGTVGYKVYQDGEEIYRHHASAGSILTFTAIGGGEFEVKVWDPYQIWQGASQYVFYAGFAFMLCAIIIALAGRYRR